MTGDGYVAADDHNTIGPLNHRYMFEAFSYVVEITLISLWRRPFCACYYCVVNGTKNILKNYVVSLGLKYNYHSRVDVELSENTKNNMNDLLFLFIIVCYLYKI